jgi:hypothetical protein
MDKVFEVYSAANAGLESEADQAAVTDNLIHDSNRLQLNTYQAFIRSVANPASDFRSLMLVHMTGTGKTITALATATEYVRQYQARADGDSSVTAVVVLGYTKDIFKKELLSHPEFMFISREEATALRDLEQHAQASSVVNEQYELLRKRYQRRIVNRDRMGVYQFYGYRQFANMVFNHDDLVSLLKTQDKSSIEDVDPKLLQTWVEEQKLRVNTNFIAGLRRSLFICDEVHNLYRNGALNTYGIAIGLVFDYFFKTLPPDHIDHGAIRSLLLSATPLTSSALEIIPITQLLTGERLAAASLFKPVLGVDQLTPEGAATVRQVVSGKISYVMDDNPAEYPSVSFAGSEIPDVRFARFVRLRPEAHQLSCLQHWADRGGADEEYGNNMAKDIAFPGSPVRPYGVLYSQHLPTLREVPEPLSVHIESNGLYDSPILTSPLLRQHSCKYAELVNLCSTLVGKVFIYHPQVQGSGTNLVVSVLMANGFVLNGDHPGRRSRCAMCPKLKEAHSSKTDDHEFMPVQFTYVTGSLTKTEVSARLRAFNRTDSDGGKHLKIIVGSKAMREGHSLAACRHVIVAHEPGSISELVQIIGRAVRKKSHARLPADERNVQIHILTMDLGELPELVRQSVGANEELSYKLKLLQYEQIRQIEQIMHDVALDYLINFRFKQRETPSLLGEDFPLDLPRYQRYQSALTAIYSDLRNGVAPEGIHTNRFNVFYFEGEVRLTMMVIKRIILDHQPAVSVAQLEALVREPPFYVEYNTRLISDEAIAVAIHKLTFKRSQRRLAVPNRSLSVAASLFDQSPVLVDTYGQEYRIVYIGMPLCRQSYLTKRTMASILRGDEATIDSYRHILPTARQQAVDLQELSRNWAATLDIRAVVDGISAQWEPERGFSLANQQSLVRTVSKLPMKTQARLVEWAIELAVGHTTGSVAEDGGKDLEIVRFLLDELYTAKRLVFTVADLGRTRLAKTYARFNTATSTPWYRPSTDQPPPSTASMPIGHAIGLFRVYQPALRKWLELRSVGNADQSTDESAEHPYGFYIYEERKGLSVVAKIRFEDDPKAKGIQMVFLPKEALARAAKKLGVATRATENKVDIVAQLERAAWAIQATLYPKRVIYKLVEM